MKQIISQALGNLYCFLSNSPVGSPQKQTGNIKKNSENAKKRYARLI